MFIAKSSFSEGQRTHLIMNKIGLVQDEQIPELLLSVKLPSQSVPINDKKSRVRPAQVEPLFVTCQ